MVVLLSGRRSQLEAAAILVVAYWATAVLGLQWAIVDGAGSSVWPAAGIAVAGLWLGGVSLWPAILVGRLAAGLTVGSSLPLWAELLIAAGNSLAAVIAVLLLQLLRADIRIVAMGDLLRLTAAVVASATIAATIGTAALSASAALGGNELLIVSANWWFGNVVGMLIVVPLIVTWSSREVWNWRQWAHFAIGLLAAGAISYLVFFRPELTYLRTWYVFPVLIWVALAFQVRGAAAALLIVAATAIWGATEGFAFSDLAGTQVERVFLAQQFAAIASITTLLLASVADERRGKEALKASEQQLRKSEERLRMAHSAGGIVIWDWNIQIGKVTWSGPLQALLGLPEDSPSFASFEDLMEMVHPDDKREVETALGTTLKRSKSLDLEFRMLLPNKEERWLASRGEVVQYEEGEPTRVIGVCFDITARRKAADAVKEQARILELLNKSGTTLAAKLDLEQIVQTVTDAATAASGAQFGAFFYNVVDECGEIYQLYTLSGAPREAFKSFPMPRNTAVFGPTFRGEGIIRQADITADPRYGQNPPHHGMPPGHLPVRSYLAVPVISRSGEVLGGLFLGHEKTDVFTSNSESIVSAMAAQAAVAIDNAMLFRAAEKEVDERRRSEERQKLLIHELNHRIKNTLATVQSIAMQTLTSIEKDQEARSTFVARLIALAKAHGLLTSQSWEGIGLTELATSALEPFRAGRPEKIQIRGDNVFLPPNLALNLSIALHELATNATKYGALSNDSGRVVLSWRRDADAGSHQLRLEWRESGGPTVKPPTRRGFGTRLIADGLGREIGGAAELEFDSAGLVCRVELPLRKVSQ